MAFKAICPGWVLTPLVQKQVYAKAAYQNISNEDAKRQLLSVAWNMDDG